MRIRTAITLPLLLTSISGCLSGSEPAVDSDVAALTDPYGVHAPLYQISMAVLTDETANVSTAVWKDTYSTSFGPYDQIRAGIGAYLEPATGGLVRDADPVTCIIGDQRDRGTVLDPELVFLTQPGGAYTTCMADPDVPDMAGRPLQFAAPIPVGPADNLDLYARLEVLNSGVVIAPASDPTAGVGGGLAGIGNVWQRAGSIAGLIPGQNVEGVPEPGNVFSGAGAIVQTIGEIMMGQQRPAEAVCAVTNSLIPGWGDGQTPTDTPSPLFRVQLTGRALWDQTANGDALLYYSLDWGSPSYTRLCKRPKTRIVFRIRRVSGENLPGNALATRGQMLSPTYPDQLDAFLVDGAQHVLHDQWNTSAWAHSSEALTNMYSTLRCHSYYCYSVDTPIFPANAHIVTVAKAGGNQDIYGVAVNGRIASNWRNKDYDSNHWHPWEFHSGGYFPPGAPVAAISRRPGHVEYYAVANDGSIMTNGWDATSGWGNDAVRITPPGTVRPWDGTSGGGIAAVSMGTAPYDHVMVYAAGVHDELVQVSYNLFGGWSFIDNAGPTGVTYTSGGNFAVVQRTPGRAELFFVDATGRAREVWFDNSGWHSQQILPDTMALVPGAEAAIVSRKTDLMNDPYADDDHMDFFTVATSGSIAHNLWRAGHNSDTWNVNDADLITTVAATPGGPIGAITPYPGSVQVAVRKPDGTLGHTWFKDTELIGLRWETAP